MNVNASMSVIEMVVHTEMTTEIAIVKGKGRTGTTTWIATVTAT